MRVLALDTAGAQAAVALWEGASGSDGPDGFDDHVLAARAEAMDRGQAEALLPMVEGAMADAGLGFESIDRIAVTRGPGAFTGIRIGLAAARGLALAAGVPVVGIATTDAVAAAVPESMSGARAVLVALDTKRGDFYAAVVSADGTAAAPVVVAPDGLAALLEGERGVLVVGDGAADAAAALQRGGVDAVAGDVPALVDAAWVARLGAMAEVGSAVSAPDPLYLRPPAVNLPGIGRIG